MGKYEPLNAFLKSQHEEVVPMTFAQIEKVLGNRLPPSKKQRAWWSNNPTNNVMTKEWLDAGYETESVDIAGEKLVFRKIAGAPSGLSEAAAKYTTPRGRHPGFGFMKGQIKFAEGFDGTGPYDDEPWDQGYLGEDRLSER